MIFLSAQPDQYYFYWQLRLQLFNFKRLAIKPQNIIVLIGYNQQQGLSNEFNSLILEYPKVNICAYPDTRLKKDYLSSIRPHIITKHFKAFPNLVNETIFYHDSDIIFSSLPNFELLLSNEVWYTSDTRLYLDVTYIKSFGDEDLLANMCAVIGIEPQLVIENDNNAGGAQYLIKKCSLMFWEKIEKDCENLFSLLSAHKCEKGFCNNTPTINPWITDMWVIWWNALLINREFRIHKELNFSWASSDIKEWKLNKILHYTGAVTLENKSLFRKSNYFYSEPFFDDFCEINKSSCSYPLIKLIKKYNKQTDKLRIDLKDVTFLITVRVDSQDKLENIYAVTKYLCRHFKTNILLLEVDKTTRLKNRLLHKDVTYYFVKDDYIEFHRTKYNNILIDRATTPYISIYDADIILPINQIVESVKLLRNSRTRSVLPYDGNCYSTDIFLKAMFIKVLEDKFLVINKNKQSNYSKRAVGGCIFLEKSTYISAGCDNEKIRFFGTEVTERIKRMKILGYGTKRINGPLFHLYRGRYENSDYQNLDQNIELNNEYLKVANSSKLQLKEYIKTWEWVCKTKKAT